MNEFGLIDAILLALGPATGGDAVVLGPGDDAAAVRLPAGELLVSSIDALVAGVHFPGAAPAELVGYRALMVSLSDLAAMGAVPSHVLVSLTLERADTEWVTSLATGMRQAALQCQAPLVGGNVTRGECAIHVSVHGTTPESGLLRRSGAVAGDGIYVTGDLGGAAAAIAAGLPPEPVSDELDPLSLRYFRPVARLEAGVALRGKASCAVDISDGLLQDLAHLCAASSLCGAIDSARLPLCTGTALQHALTGGDDYELLFCAAGPPGDLGVRVTRIGEMIPGRGVLLDGAPVEPRGYLHFS